MEEEKIRQFAKDNFVPIIRPKTLKYLIESVKVKNPKNILEIGTAIGYSGIKMLENSNASLVTIEKDEKMLKLAQVNFREENLTERIQLVFDDAMNFLKQNTQKFDFIFLDGPKGQYINYLPFLLNCLEKNGVMFCDNVLFQGLVNSNAEPPKKFRTIVRNLEKFILKIKQSENLSYKLYDIEDGFLIVWKK